VRQDWERASHPALLQVLEEEVAKNPETTIFIPTGIAMTVETVIRNINRLKSAAGGGAKLKFRIRFSSQGHERRGLHPSYFGLQLKRWHDRAGDVDLRFGIEVESMAQRYAQVSGLDVAWVPWPNEATNCAPRTTALNPAAPHIYIYASRREQGTEHAERIVKGLQATLPSAARYTVQIGTKGTELFPDVVRRLKGTKGVTFSGSGLPPAQLHALFADASAIILPYDLRRYKGRGSALMWAALDHGIPMIAPVGTGFGDDIARHGIGYSYRHLDEIPALVQRAVAESDELASAIARYQVRRTEAVAAYLYA
jgi:glycosyltransferase involved in cell wall biosynthesis